MARAMAVATGKEHEMLALMAGRASAPGAAAQQVGRAIERRRADVVRPRRGAAARAARTRRRRWCGGSGQSWPPERARIGAIVEGMQLASGMLLVATPALQDPNFADTVVLLLDVNDEGALGVVLNRPSQVLVADVLEPWREVVAEPEVLFRGGPVGTDGALAVARLRDTEAAPGRLAAGRRAAGHGRPRHPDRARRRRR